MKNLSDQKYLYSQAHQDTLSANIQRAAIKYINSYDLLTSYNKNFLYKITDALMKLERE